MQEAVFLIDTHLAICSAKDHCTEILLVVYRLLGCLAAKTKAASSVVINDSLSCAFPAAVQNLDDKDRTSSQQKISHIQSFSGQGELKWSFKIFNSSRNLSRNKTSLGSSGCFLKSFKLAYLEDFERKLTDIFSLEIAEVKTAKQKTNPVSPCPAELLSVALTELLHDFKWTSSDAIASPAFKRKTKKPTSSYRSVFIFSKAPKCRQSLRRYCNKVVLDSDVFLDSVMSPALYSEYVDKLNISVSFVDFSSESCLMQQNGIAKAKEAGTEFLILSEAFKKLKGNFILKNVILYPVPVEGASCSEICSVPDSAVTFSEAQFLHSFPFESFFMNQWGGPKTPGLKVEALMSCKSFHCLPVCLTPLAPAKLNRKHVNIPTKMEASQKRKEDETEDCVSDPLCVPTDLARGHIVVLGCLPASQVCHLVLSQLSASWLMSCHSSQVHQLFHQLNICRYSGICRIALKGQPVLSLAVLQVLSQDMGVLSVLNMNAWDQLQNLCSAVVYSQGDKISQVQSDVTKSWSDLCNTSDTDLWTQPELPGSWQPLSQMFQSHCMNSWHVPGSCHQTSSIAIQMTERVPAVNSQTSDFLRDLQKLYQKEKQPPELTAASVQSLTGVQTLCGFQRFTSGECHSQSESESKSSLGDQPRASLSRGRLMVTKSKSSTFSLTEDDEADSFLSKPSSPAAKGSHSAGNAQLEVQTEEDLSSYLQKQYDQVLNAGVAVVTTVHNLVTVAVEFMTRRGRAQPISDAINLIRSHLTLNFAAIKEKYRQENSEDKTKFITEYKLQSLLLLEMLSLVRDTENFVPGEDLKEILCMMRAISFMAGTRSLMDFLLDLVARYSKTLTQLLVDVFDELMLPLPPELAVVFSPSESGHSSIANLSVAPEDLLGTSSINSCSQFDNSELSQQSKSRSQKLKQHPSISDFRQKKQILVKSTSFTQVECKTRAHVSRKHSTKSKLKDCGTTKRSLFTDRNKQKSRVKDKGGHHKGKAKTKSPRTLALATPLHKQRRFLSPTARSEGAQAVVAESPLKDDDEDGSCLDIPASYIVREGFYSGASQPSRNLPKSLSQTDQPHGLVTGFPRYLVNQSRQQGTLASAVRGEHPILSPRSRLLHSFTSSPSPKSRLTHRFTSSSPLRRSPRKTAKRLIFKESFPMETTDLTNTPPTDNESAHLIFDGDNANDFDLLTISSRDKSKGDKTNLFDACLLQANMSHLEAKSHSSSLSHRTSGSPSLNFSFKNILSSPIKKL